MRYDQFWLLNPKGVTTDEYDGGKGLELIPFEKVEVIFNMPPYLEHNSPAERDGFGDLAFLVKYRFISGNEEHGNYILAAFLGEACRPASTRTDPCTPSLLPRSLTAKAYNDSTCRALLESDCRSLIPRSSAELTRGTTPFSMTSCESFGLKWNLIQHSSSRENMTV